MYVSWLLCCQPQQHLRYRLLHPSLPTPLSLSLSVYLSLTLSVWTDVKIISMVPPMQTVEQHKGAVRQKGEMNEESRAGCRERESERGRAAAWQYSRRPVELFRQIFDSWRQRQRRRLRTEPCLKLSFDFKPNSPIMRCAAKPKKKTTHTNTHKRTQTHIETSRDRATS